MTGVTTGFNSSYRFTADQLKAMDHYFFAYKKNLKFTDWNAVPMSNGIWEKCLEIIISDYDVEAEYNSSSIAKKAVEVLNPEYESESNLKGFFCTHLITSPSQIEERLHRFINRNGDGAYLCLMPSNTSCFVKCELGLEDASSKQLRQLDLLIEAAPEKEIEKVPIQVLNQKREGLKTCSFSIVLDDAAAISRIAASIDSAIGEKIKSLNKPNRVLRATLIAGLAIGVIILTNQHRVRQWIEELSRHWTRS